MRPQFACLNAYPSTIVQTKPLRMLRVTAHPPNAPNACPFFTALTSCKRRPHHIHTQSHHRNLHRWRLAPRRTAFARTFAHVASFYHLQHRRGSLQALPARLHPLRIYLLRPPSLQLNHQPHHQPHHQPYHQPHHQPSLRRIRRRSRRHSRRPSLLAVPLLSHHSCHQSNL